MTKENNQEQERKIWEFYMEKCRQDGTKPSVQGFKEWATSLMKKT